MRSASLSLILAFTAALSLSAQSRPDTTRLQRLLVAEDARGTGADGLTPLLTEIHATDPLFRRVAARGLGRLQRPDFIATLVLALSDPVPAVRSEAANGLAQAVSRIHAPAVDSAAAQVRTVARALVTALGSERNDTVAGNIAEALGRLLYGDSTDLRAAERAILDRSRSGIGFDAARGLYRLAFNRRTIAGLSSRAITMLRDATRPPHDAPTRRMAVLALTQAGALDTATVLAAVADPDEQVRRLGLGGIAALDPSRRREIARAALNDLDPIVRVAAIAAIRVGNTAPDCSPIDAATNDRSSYVALTAIDALGLRCEERSTAASVLVDVISATRDAATPDHSWQRAAHALVALARIDSALVAPYLARFATSTRWWERMYAARAAALARDVQWLRRLANDADNNVRSAAIDGLARTAKHDADSIYVAALTGHGNQVLLSAAQALKGGAVAALPRLLDAFDSLSARRTENARDPRLELLQRIDEMGGADAAARLRPYIADFDTTIATTAATILTKWTGAPVRAAPRPLAIRPEPLATPFLATQIQLRVTMAASSGGGTFTVRLFPDETPATVARIVRLARAHYYDGHVLQRVEPNFVIQGGGPDASEYVGDATFMRDELASRSHLRGTFGISSRGRDTGDAQWFINLADNPRLDHDYTVFGEVVSGRGVVDQILEGDVIGRVEVLWTGK